MQLMMGAIESVLGRHTPYIFSYVCCRSRICTSGRCVEATSCSNLVQDGLETGALQAAVISASMHMLELQRPRVVVIQGHSSKS